MPTTQTEAILNHHMESFNASDLDAVMSDYSEDSVIHSQLGSVKGLAQIRKFFGDFLGSLPDGALRDMEMLHTKVDGDVAFIVWKMPPRMKMGSDTFLIQNGKIIAQTVVAYTGK
jgi:ketosteroid isomerase-like protein